MAKPTVPVINPFTSRLFSFTVFPDLQAQSCKQYKLGWGEVCHYLTQDNPDAKTKKELPLVVGGEFGDLRTSLGALRHDSNLKSMSFVLVDYDEGSVSMEAAAKILRDAGIAAFVFPTPSWAKDKPKWRAAIPLSKDLEGDLETVKAAHKRVVDHLRSIGLQVSVESNTLTQAYYFGRLKTMPEVDWRTPVDGDFVDAVLEDDLSWATGKHRDADMDRLKDIICTGREGVHDALRTASMVMIARGHPADDTRVLLESWMRKWQSDDSRWADRFREVGRLVRGAVRRVDKNPTLRLRDGGQDDPDRAPRAAIDLGERPEYHPQEFVVDGFIPAGLSVIGGTWGIGKTSNLLPLLANAAHITPKAWGMHSTIRRKIIWVSESPPQALMLLTALARLEGSAAWAEVKEWFQIWPSRREPAKKVAEFLKEVVDQATFPFPENPDFLVRPLVVLDTVSANFEMDDESSNAEASAVLSALKEALPGAPIMAVAHTPKALRRADLEDQTVRGAGAWEADAEATYFMIRDDNDNRVFAIAKRRFTPVFHEVAFATHTESVLIPQTPWMQPQAFSATLGLPRESDREIREAATRERQDGERAEAVLTAVRSLLGQGQIPTGNTILDFAGGRRNGFGTFLQGMVTEGTLARSGVLPTHRPNNRVTHGFHLPGEVPDWADGSVGS